jgi:hypothetical protein
VSLASGCISSRGCRLCLSGARRFSPRRFGAPRHPYWVCKAEFDTSLNLFAGVTWTNPVWVALTASIKGLTGYTWLLLVLHAGGPVVTG